PFLDARLNTNMNVSKLTPLFEDIILDGTLTADLACRGPFDDLKLSGDGRISGGLVQVQSYPLLVTNIEGNFDFSKANTPNFTLSGILNGGKTEFQGKAILDSNQLKSANIEAKADQVQLSYPEGFQALVNGDFSLSKKEQKWFLTGRAELTQSFYGADIYPGSELIRSLRSQRKALQSDIPPLLRSLNLGIDIATIDPFVVDNNLASLEMEGNIRVGGTVYEPKLSGFFRNRQAGEIIFNNRNYEVERASIDFADADPLDGMLNITAHTQLRYEFKDLDITLNVTGPITGLRFSLSSSESMSEIDLALILLTGYGSERLRNEAANIIGNQMMLYFLSPFASPFTNTLKNILGAEEVRIEPINIATEADPGARFTFRKGLVSALDLIYSIDISNTQNQTWILDYNLSRNFTLQSYAKDDGSYGGSFSHRFTLGGPARPSGFSIGSRSRQYTIKDIRYSDIFPFSKKILEDKSRPLKKHSKFKYSDLRTAIEKMTEHYRNNGFLNAVISPSLQYEDQNSVTILFDVKRTAPASLIFTGDPISTKLKKQTLSQWNGRLPEEMSMSEAEKKIKLELNSKGYIQAEVTASKTEEETESFYVIFVHFGPRYKIGKFSLSEESAVPAKSIKKAVSSMPRPRGKGLWALLYDFKRAKLRIVSMYEELGYQDVSIQYPEISLRHEERKIDIVLPVKQGMQSRVHSVEIAGNVAIQDRELMPLLTLKSQDLFSPDLLSTDTNMLYSFYREKGYQNVKIDVQVEKDADTHRIDLVYTISEGELLTISEIAVKGNRRTAKHVIRRELVFHEGEPLNMINIITSQKNLYDLMAFNSVNIYQLPLEEQSNKVQVVVDVQESPPLAVSYGLRYNSEEKIEGFGQLDFVNLLGRGRSGLIFYRENKREKDLRFSLKDPYLFGQKLNTLYSLFYLEKTESVFKSEEYGFSVQQELKMPFESRLSYLFRYNRTHTYELDPIGPFPFDITLSLPEFQVFWLRDTRDNMINAKQGSFLSLSLKYSPSFLKTDLTYISFFGQYSLYLPVRPFFIWASNFRIGLADAFDQVLIPSRRFFAGGANSIRGFERDTVGPYNYYLKHAEGGEALFIINQELRFPVYKWLEGVVFFDVGNVYETLRDINLLKFRAALGMGLRLNLPVIFLRLDYGFNLAPREFESRRVFYISIGQAF
ncbi:MAG: outer membrane protein assembly factor BamA, partial [Candidatus Aminicenantes bacterium]|nr:outer membrane protein assembly factor BamA [Candidatus Aminicenantes bacterium]